MGNRASIMFAIGIMNPEDGNDEPSHRSRLEDQILEILTRTDRPPTSGERIRAWLRRARQSFGRTPHRSSVSGILGRLGQGTWLLASFLAAVGALLIEDTSPLFGRLLAILCVVFFAIPIVVRWRRPEQPDIKRWRGRDVDFRDGPPDLLDDLRRRFRRPPKR